MRLYSFDVFETVLIRCLGEPKHVFDLVAKRALELNLVSFDPLTFRDARIRAERSARTNAIHEEITHTEIYDQLQYLLDLSADQASFLLNIEQSIEMEVARVNPSLVELTNRMRERYGRLIYISDMYLPQHIVESMLRNVGAFQSCDSLYLSSTQRLQKRTGSLFKKVLEVEHLLPNELSHIGDNYDSDYIMPRSLGIRTRQYCGTQPSRWETFWNEEYNSGRLGPYNIAGVARLARLSGSCFTETESSIITVAAGVAAPYLTGFCAWLLSQAQANQWTDLYFVARDGLMLFDVTKVLIGDSSGVHPEIHYLYGSREAWYVALLGELCLPKWTFLCRALMRGDTDVREYLRLVGLDSDSAALRAVCEKGLMSVTSNSEQERLFSEVIDTPEFYSRATSYIEAKRVALLGYLTQEGVCRGAKCVLVDTGWSGLWQDVICEMLEEAGYEAPSVAVFGILKRDFVLKRRVQTFLFDASRELGLFRHAAWLYCPTEMFTLADHGRTVGYRFETGKWIPLLSNDVACGLPRETLNAFRRTVISFSEEFRRFGRDAADLTQLGSVCLRCLDLFWHHPEQCDYSPYISYSTGCSFHKDADQNRIRAFTISDSLRAICGRNVFDGELWIEACMMHTPQFTLLVLKLAVRTRRFVSRIRRAFISRTNGLLCFIRKSSDRHRTNNIAPTDS